MPSGGKKFGILRRPFDWAARRPSAIRRSGGAKATTRRRQLQLPCPISASSPAVPPFETRCISSMRANIQRLSRPPRLRRPDRAPRRAMGRDLYGGGKVGYDHAELCRRRASLRNAGALRTRLEQALTRIRRRAEEVITLLGGQMPNTLDAQLALAAAYVEDGQNCARGPHYQAGLDKQFPQRGIRETHSSRFGRSPDADRSLGPRRSSPDA